MRRRAPFRGSGLSSVDPTADKIKRRDIKDIAGDGAANNTGFGGDKKKMTVCVQRFFTFLFSSDTVNGPLNH